MIVYFLFILIIIILIYRKPEYFSNEMCAINKFDKILYINLDHRKDRNSQILNEFSKYKINKNKIIRIDAIYNKLNGHIGCAKSHIKALTLAKKMNLKNVIIFEDDFVFTKDLNTINLILNKFYKDFGKNWDIVQLTTVNNIHTDLININKDYIKKVNHAPTSSAYIIQNHFYNDLINDLNKAIKKMENEMKTWKLNKKKVQTPNALDQHWKELQRNSNWYVFYPYLGKQGGEAIRSSIK